MKAETKALITVSLIVAIGAVLFFASKDNQPETTDVTLKSYSEKDVSGHKTKNDCWAIINGNVYDLTSYVKGHPGGDNILSACGVDATEYFNGKKKGQAGGTNNHNDDSQALSQLENLKIGTLSN